MTDLRTKSYKKASRYVKQYHPEVWKKLDHNASAHAVMLAAIECYNKTRTPK